MFCRGLDTAVSWVEVVGPKRARAGLEPLPCPMITSFSATVKQQDQTWTSAAWKREGLNFSLMMLKVSPASLQCHSFPRA